MFDTLFVLDSETTLVEPPQKYDRKKAWLDKVHANAENNIGSWLGISILKDSIKRAKNNGFKIDIDKSYLVELWHKQQGLCAISKIKMEVCSGTRSQKNPKRASLDRIDNSKGYIKGNVRFVCHWVNNAKSTWTDEVFKEFILACANK